MENGAAWENLAVVINGNVIVRLANNTDGRLNADAIRIEKIG
jgi:hypothetical protein